MRPDDIMFKTYQLNQNIRPYMDIEVSIRKTFLEKLIEDRIITAEEIEIQTLDYFSSSNSEEMTEKLRKDYRDMLIDFYFVSTYSKDIIESYINLARKHDKIKILTKAVTRENKTSKEIKKIG